MRYLNDDQFHATFAHKMQEVKPDDEVSSEVIAAAADIATDQLDGFALGQISVEYVYRGDSGLFEHYLIPTTTKNVYLVLVRDTVESILFGYHVLNLNANYGLPTREPDEPTTG
jgi:hypothetical protein